MGAARHADGMNINMYVINAILVLMVVRQIREHSLDLRSLAVPVLAVGAAAVMFLHSVPGGGNDIALELAGVLAGAAMGAVGGLATRLRRGADGRALGRAGVLAAGMWVAGVGGRMAFVFAATHGAGPAIGRFSIAHHITGQAAPGPGRCRRRGLALSFFSSRAVSMTAVPRPPTGREDRRRRTGSDSVRTTNPMRL